MRGTGTRGRRGTTGRGVGGERGGGELGSGGADEGAVAMLPVPLCVAHIIAMLFARMRLAQRVGEGEDRRADRGSVA